MSESDRVHLNRAAFVAGSLAAMGAGLPQRGAAASPPPAGVSPEQLLGRLMAGNRRFLDNDFPSLSKVAEKREVLREGQAPYAAIVSCSDSRVVPNFVFVQGMGELFVVRVAGNFPDDLVIASLEYSIAHLGSRLVMVLGHENCGAIKSVYSAIESNARLIAPGIKSVVRARGSADDAVEANVRAAVEKLKSTPPVISKEVAAKRVLVVGGLYHLGSGQVTLIE